ncbi:MAG: hypothetical protein K0S33_4270 [Bacteroidetes bacterium]|jgi:hypothetical protein|nr:hypothetical protein [Bacteroidota bacterium]
MPKKNPAFAIIVLVLALLEIYRITLHPFDLYGIASVLIAATGIVLFFKGHSAYDKFLYAWIFMQVPNIYFTDAAGVQTPIMNAFSLSMFLDLGAGSDLGLKGKRTLTVYLNVLPIGLYYLFKFLNVDKPLGYSFVVNRLKKGSFPNAQFPLKGKINRLAGREKVTGVYEIFLETGITIGSKTYDYVLLEPKKNTLIDTNGKKQICALRICDIPGMKYSKKQNRFVEWVTVEADKIY